MKKTIKNDLHIEPNITQEAPRVKALVICPTDLIPPSAIIGIPNFFAYLLVSYTAQP